MTDDNNGRDIENNKQLPQKGTGSTMPLRSKAKDVSLVKLPDSTQEVLGEARGADEVEVRFSSQMHWDSTTESPRQQQLRSEAKLRTALDLRTRTTLSYELPDNQRARVNNMHSPQVNTGRKHPESEPANRITIKIK